MGDSSSTSAVCSAKPIGAWDLNYARYQVAKDLHETLYDGGTPILRPQGEKEVREWKGLLLEQREKLRQIELSAYAKAAKMLIDAIPDGEDREITADSIDQIGARASVYVAVRNAISESLNPPTLSHSDLGWKIGIGEMQGFIDRITNYVARQIGPVSDFVEALGYLADGPDRDERSRLAMLASAQIVIDSAAMASLNRFLATNGGIIRRCIDEVFDGVGEYLGIKMDDIG